MNVEREGNRQLPNLGSPLRNRLGAYKKRVAKWPFLRYVTESWLTHARGSIVLGVRVQFLRRF
jgi:hypothetical protein